MNLEIIIMEPLYQINLGYIARVMKNFGFTKLNLVKPRCNYRGKQAIKYSKHAHELLEKAKIYKNLESAIEKNSLVLGTTGIWHKSDKSFFNIYTVSKIRELIKKNKTKNVTLLIGRDDTGLSKDEIKMCDATLFIPTSKDYSVLNISHALAILLYELNKDELAKEYMIENFYADKTGYASITKLFERSIKNRDEIRNKKAVAMTFAHIIKRSNPTKRELSALAIALSPKFKKKKKE